MLYLEDYVELIEHLPVDLRDRFTDMREMDLQVQNTVDDLNSKVKSVFRACLAKKGKTDDADSIFEEIRSTYYKALEDADEKVQLANQIYDLVDRHLRKLDQELAKFKMELEADNAGITEILESRSLELDNHVSQSTHGHHKRKHQSHLGTTSSSQLPPAHLSQPSNGLLEKKIKMENITDEMLLKTESAPSLLYSLSRESLHGSENDSDLGNSCPLSHNSATAGGVAPGQVSALDLAKAQAVQATVEMQVGRRTSSMKANYEAFKANDFPINLQMQEDTEDILSCIADEHCLIREDMDGDSSHGDTSSITSPNSANISRPSRTKKQTSKAAAWNQERMQAEARRGHREKEHNTSITDESVVEMIPESGTSGLVEWSCDPNEPRYCICNQVSYGEMVGCDNEKCTVEWFHYGCVGLTEAPKGKWYCQQCTQTMKRRNKNR